ncbi:MAG TPA: hypothetical protein VMH41_04310 [Mycobacteriales bacterium]|nr:hypothetical protein [Mycobacteriales bacterium]
MVLWVFLALLVVFVFLPFIGAAIWWTLTALVGGIILGILARMVVPGRQNIGLLATIACGWIGSLGGGLLGGLLWGFDHNHHRFATVLLQIGVAAIAVAIWSRATRNRPRRSVIYTSDGKFHRIIDI